MPWCMAPLVQHICTNGIFFMAGIKKHGLLFRLKFEETRAFLKIGLYHVSGQVINYFNKDLDIFAYWKALWGGNSRGLQPG